MLAHGSGVAVFLAVNIGGEIQCYDPVSEVRTGWPPPWDADQAADNLVAYFDHRGDPVLRFGETNYLRLTARSRMDDALARLPVADRLQLADEFEALNEGFAAAMDRGVAPGSEEANALAERHLDYAQELFPDYGYESHRADGRRLVTMAAFRDPYEWIAPGLARYVRDVIVANAERRLGPPDDPHARPVGPRQPGNPPSGFGAAAEHPPPPIDARGGSGPGEPESREPTGGNSGHLPARSLGNDVVVHPLGDAQMAVQRARANAALWKSLSEDQWRTLIETHPDKIGNADGIPMWACHQANTRLLGDWLRYRGQLQSRLGSGETLDDGDIPFISLMNRFEADWQVAIEAARAAGVDGPYLFRFNPRAFAGVGRAIVVFSKNCEDPYEAQSVSWHIPGRGATLDEFGRLMGRALNQLASTLREEPALPAGSIAWLGYRTVFEDKAQAEQVARVGGEILLGGICAFNATHNAWAGDGRPFSGHHVFGHCQGGRVAGYAGQRERLDGQARTITLIGMSRGVGPITHASQFGPNIKVYVAASSADPATWQGDDTPGSNETGVDPAMDVFAARRITAEIPLEKIIMMGDYQLHNSYYDHVATGVPGEALANFGRIAAGHPERVKFDGQRRIVVGQRGEYVSDPAAERQARPEDPRLSDGGPVDSGAGPDGPQSQQGVAAGGGRGDGGGAAHGVAGHGEDGGDDFSRRRAAYRRLGLTTKARLTRRVDTGLADPLLDVLNNLNRRQIRRWAKDISGKYGGRFPFDWEGDEDGGKVVLSGKLFSGDTGVNPRFSLVSFRPGDVWGEMLGDGVGRKIAKVTCQFYREGRDPVARVVKLQITDRHFFSRADEVEKLVTAALKSLTAELERCVDRIEFTPDVYLSYPRVLREVTWNLATGIGPVDRDAGTGGPESHDGVPAESHADLEAEPDGHSHPVEHYFQTRSPSGDAIENRQPDDTLRSVAGVLTQIYGRAIHLEPGSVTVRELFVAAGSAVESASYAEVGDTLRYLGRDSSAIVASIWADRPGAAVFLAVNIKGEIHYYGPVSDVLRGWPPPWGQDQVSAIMVAYLDAHGNPVLPWGEYDDRWLSVRRRADDAWAGLPEAGRSKLTRDREALNDDFATAMDRGVAPGSDQANALAERDLASRRTLCADYGYVQHRYDARRFVTNAAARRFVESRAPGLARLCVM
jgi:hypothetical protein